MGRGSAGSLNYKDPEVRALGDFLNKRYEVFGKKDGIDFLKSGVYQGLSEGLPGSKKEVLQQVVRDNGGTIASDRKFTNKQRLERGMLTPYKALNISSKTLARINKLPDKARNAFLKKRYGRLAKVYHPDTGAPKTRSAAAMQQLTLAYKSVSASS